MGSNNINIEDATCPHCRQRVILEKINPLVKNKDIKNENTITSLYVNNNIFGNNSQIHPINIRYNSQYNLSESEIDLINLNLNNQIPENPFLHNSSDENNSNCKNFLFFICCILLVVLLIILIVTLV